MSLAFIVLIAGFVGIMIILIVVGLTSRTTSDDVAARLEGFASRSAPLSLEEIELSQPFSQRIILPILKGLASFVTRFTPAHTEEAARHNLDMA